MSLLQQSSNSSGEFVKQSSYQRQKCITKLGHWKIFYDQKEKQYMIKSRDLNQIEDLISLQLTDTEKQYVRHKQMERKMNQPTSYQQERRNRFFADKQLISDLGEQLEATGIEDEGKQQNEMTIN